MRISPRPLAAVILMGLCGIASGAGSGSAPSIPRIEAQRATPAEQAREVYNAGVKGVEKADELSAAAARQTDENKRRKAETRAQQHYEGALKKFTRATEFDPRMHEAWNYRGYTQRKLGNYPAALEAYDRALALQPGFAPAIEYRGHAYLGLNRLQDAQQAYLTLFSSNRALASQLLKAMQDWVRTRPENSQGVDPAALAAFASWVEERQAIAGPTAALTREGSRAGW